MPVQETRSEDMTMPQHRATWNNTVIAESAETIVVDGYLYFPASSVRPEHLRPSTHHSVCGWKGQASYYDVAAGGDVNRNAAWCYPDPMPEAKMVEGYVGFWHGVAIEEIAPQETHGRRT
ncbi:MAG: DUF427 domain-containing protein [Acidimicrobiales bacterium]